MTLIGAECSECGEEELVVVSEEVQVGEQADIKCQNCGHETTAVRVSLEEHFK